MSQYLVGYYKPSFEFSRIPEFMAIFDQEGALIGLTGPSTSRKSALDARLFAAAPDLLTTLKNICEIINNQTDLLPQPLHSGHEPHPELLSPDLLNVLHHAEQLTQLVENNSLFH